jgi:hypothetical protein
MINGFGEPELLTLLVWGFFAFAIGLGFPVALVSPFVQINIRLKSIEDVLRRDV